MKLFRKQRKVGIEKFNQLKSNYMQELKRRDELIDELEKKNELLLKSALKQSDSANYWQDQSKRLEKALEDLNQELEITEPKKA